MNKLLLSLLLISSSAIAQTTYYRDQYNNVVGSANTLGSTTYYKDATNTVVGTENRVGDTSYYGDIRNNTIGSGTTQYQRGSDGYKQQAPNNPYYQSGEKIRGF
jgi:hypothetical protein